MKQNISYFIDNSVRSLALMVLMVLMATLAPVLVRATPYATSLTNNGDGSISFRLNQTTGTNDLVQVISGGGTSPIPCSRPVLTLPMCSHAA